jgi:hypothetical protein
MFPMAWDSFGHPLQNHKYWLHINKHMRTTFPCNKQAN